MMDWGLTLPNKFVPVFDPKKRVKPGSQIDLKLTWDKKVYSVKLCHVNRRKGKVYQIRWDNNKVFLRKLRKTFIQSYVILKSQKELFELSNSKRKHFRTKLPGGQQEVLIFEPIDTSNIKCETFIKIENEWNTLFERLADENVFGWLFEKDRSYLVSRSTNWIKVKDFNKHAGAVNVIYYLANTKKKILYIGKAEILGKRVKPGRTHQNMPGDWDKFRYDIVDLKYSNILNKIEDHTIRAFASVLMNEKSFPTLGVGGYKLVNKNWKKI
ncbi:GIY-YIG nuclease family protein [Patescibacteria group bacterium]